MHAAGARGTLTAQSRKAESLHTWKLALHQLLLIASTQVSLGPSLTVAQSEQEVLDADPHLVLLPKANPSSTSQPCMVLPSTGSTGLPGGQSPSTLGCSCPTQTAHPCLQRKEDGLVGATQGTGHQEDRAYCSTQPLNYGFSEKGILKNVPSPDQAPGFLMASLGKTSLSVTGLGLLCTAHSANLHGLLPPTASSGPALPFLTDSEAGQAVLFGFQCVGVFCGEAQNNWVPNRGWVCVCAGHWGQDSN